MSDQTLEMVEFKRVYAATGHRINPKERHRTRMERKMVSTWNDGIYSWKEGQCKVCGKDLPEMNTEQIDFPGLRDLKPTICDECEPIVDEHYDGEQSSESVDLTPVWNEKCPRLYKEITDNFNALGSNINERAYHQVLAWRFQKDGLYIHGESGRGKSAALWGLFKAIEKETGKHPYMVKSVNLARLLARNAKDLQDSTNGWLVNCGVLMIDDLGKEKITASFASQLFEVINGRYENFRPTIITTKYSGAQLKERFTDIGDDSTGHDIIRRLGETTKRVEF